MKFITSYVAYI